MNNPATKHIQIIQECRDKIQAIILGRRFVSFCFGFFVCFIHNSLPLLTTDNRHSVGDFQVWGAA